MTARVGPAHEDVLRAAAEVLGRHGVQALDLDELSERAGVDAAVLHTRFEGLDHVVHAALWIVRGDLTNAFIAAQARRTTWAERVGAGVKGILRYAARHPGSASLAYVEAPRLGPAVWIEHAGAMRRFARLLRSMHGEADVPPLFYETLAGAIYTSTRELVAGGRWGETDALVARVVAMCEPVDRSLAVAS